jgi:hypothetical protein
LHCDALSGPTITTLTPATIVLVRRVEASVPIEELADDIARRSLLQLLTVRPVLEADGNEVITRCAFIWNHRRDFLLLLSDRTRVPCRNRPKTV